MPPDLVRKQLSNHPARTLTMISGPMSMILGAVILAIGASLIGIGESWLPYPRNIEEPSLWLTVVVGTAFTILGIHVFVTGGIDWSRQRRRDGLREIHPAELWIWDFAWDPTGRFDDGMENIFQYFTMVVLFGLFAVIPNWLALRLGHGDWYWTLVAVFMWTVAGVFDLVILVIAGQTIYRTAQSLVYGRARLRFGQFPFFLGQRLEAYLDPPRNAAHFKSLALTLRCVEERYETRGTGSDRSTWDVCYQIYADTQTLEGEALIAGGAWPVSFPLPADGLGTCLSVKPPRYWELEVKAVAPELDYGTNFLLPVYSKL